MSKADNIFTNTPCLTEEQLLNYVQQKMSSVEMNSAERHLLDCDLCSDAVEGMQLMKDSSKATALLVDVRKNLNEKILKKKSSRKILFMDYRVLMAAASVLLLLGLSWMMMKYAANTEKKKAETAFKENFEPYHPKKKMELRDESSAKLEDKSANDLKNISPNVTDKKSSLDESPTGGNGPIKKLVGPPLRNNAGDNQTSVDITDDVSKKFDNGISAKMDSTQKTLAITSTGSSAICCGGSTTISATSPQTNFFTTSPNLQQIDSKSINGLSNQSGGNVTSNATYTWSPSQKTTTDVTTVQAQSGYAITSAKDKNANYKSSNAPAANTDFDNVVTLSDETKDTVSTLFVAGLKLYDQSKYEDANSDFSKIKSSEETFYDAQFYSGVSFLALEKADSAIQKFNYVLGFPTQEYYDDAQWYKALALVKQNKTADAKALLKILETSSATYKDKAKKLLKDLGN